MTESKIESPGDQPAPNETSRDDLIRGLYRNILHREAEPGGLETYRQVADVKRVEEALLASRELANLVISGAYFDRRWTASPRVLLFSAYGNGNLGDALQAITLQRLINEVAPAAEVWACSDMPAPFPFPHDRVLQPNQLRSSQIVNQFDLLILGGGGLLAHPHQPVCEPKWQQMLRVPVAIFAVGAERVVLRSHAALVKKASYVSGRDKESLACLRELRQDVAFVPDPMFWDRTYAPAKGKRPEGARGKKSRGQGLEKRLWILNHKVYGPGKQAFRELYDRDRDKVCFFEPHVDYSIVADIPDARPIYGVQQLFELMDNVDVVVSSRYHGCIFAMLRNKPVIGIHESKIMSLFDRFGAPGAFYNTLAELTESDWRTATPGAAFLPENQMLIRNGMLEAMQHVRTRQEGQ
jgi:polysaccharide pyruvyl transferase WcaK-like protein